jgi:hypothetical protein
MVLSFLYEEDKEKDIKTMWEKCTNSRKQKHDCEKSRKQHE